MTKIFDKLCKLYQTQYNANIFSEFDDDDKNRVRDILIAIMQAKPSSLPGLNHVLFQLMYNRFIKEQPIFKKILGPCSISLFQSKEYNKTIYVIGEIHCDKMLNPPTDLCHDSHVTIANMLDTISRTSPTFLDIYVEFPPSIKYGRAPGGFIGDIFREGSKCFIENRKGRPACTTTRWHFADVRFGNEYIQNTLIGTLYYDIGLYTIQSVMEFTSQEYMGSLPWNILAEWCLTDGELKKPLTEALTLSYIDYKDVKLPGLDKLITSLLSASIFKTHEKMFVKMMIIIAATQDKRVQEILNIIRDKNFEKLWQIIQNMYISTGYIKKELERSTASIYIEKYNKTKFDKIISEKRLASKWAKNFLAGSNNVYTKLFNFSKITDILGDIASLQMDIYLLSRIFKKFKVGEGHNQPAEPSNIVTYTGHWHARDLREFFTIGIPGFTKISEIINATCNDPSRYHENDEACCLNLRNFPQPFFSEEYSS